MAIPYGEASASLQRVIDGIDLEQAGHNSAGATAPETNALNSARIEVEGWQVDLRNSQLSPDDLPRMYGTYGNTSSSYPRLARIFTGERTVLEQMDSPKYGSRWYS